MSATIEDVVLSILAYEHRYVPWEGMKRGDLLNQAFADMDHDVDYDVLFTQGVHREKQIVAMPDGMGPEIVGELVANENETDVRSILVAATAVAWSEGFALGVFHARRLAEADPRGRP